MIKPHIAYLFWPVALGWAWRSRREHVLVGWLMALGAATALVTILCPRVVLHYLAVGLGPPLAWASATLGVWLRILFGIERRWLQFLPALGGMAAIVVWLRRRSAPWSWPAVASPLLLASAVSTPFGWSSDIAFLLPVVIDLVARLRFASLGRRAAVLAAGIASQVALWALNLLVISQIWFAWHPFVLAGLYWWGTRGCPNDGADASPTEDETKAS